jgi:hypothetical protein
MLVYSKKLNLGAMKTYNYTLQGNKERQVSKYYENAGLILKIYELIKEEKALIPPRIPTDDKRNKVTQDKDFVYYMSNTVSTKNLISMIPLVKQAIMKLSAALFRKGRGVITLER